MNLITATTLHDLGIHKSKSEEVKLIAHFQETLNERIGASTMEVLTDEQADRLVVLSRLGDAEKITAWLQKNVPEFDQIVQNEYDILMGELADSSDKL